MRDWKYEHFGQYGIDADIEALCFYLDSDYIIYEIDTDSVLYRGIGSYKHKPGHLVVSFANLMATMGADIKKTIDMAKDAFPQRGVEEYKFIYDNLISLTDPIIAIALTHQYFASDTEKAFWFFLDTAIQRCKRYIDNGDMYLMDSVQFDASIVPVNSVDGTLTHRLYYCTHGFSDIVAFEVYRASELHVPIKRCALCGKAFIPAIRSDEIYCQNPYMNGRTCSEVAFEVQSKRDPFYSAYRNAYKAESARAARMIGGGKDRITRWRERAKSKLHEYKLLDDIEGFRSWLQDNRI